MLGMCLACPWHAQGYTAETGRGPLVCFLGSALPTGTHRRCWPLTGCMDWAGCAPGNQWNYCQIERFFLSDSSHRRQRAGTGQGGLVGWVPLQVRVSQQAECP